MQSKKGKTIGLIILQGLSDVFLGFLIQEIWKLFYDPVSLSDIPFGYVKAIFGIIAFAGVIITAVLLFQHLYNNQKRYVTGVDNKSGYKSRLRDELRDIDDNL